MITGPIDPKAFRKIAALPDDFEYTVPGASERTVSINGLFATDYPGQISVQKPKGDPIAMRVRIEPSRWRSLAWWLSGWWPKSWRVRLCDKYGHPESCICRETETSVIPVDRHFAGGEYTVEFTSLSHTWHVAQWCIRCGRSGTPH